MPRPVLATALLAAVVLSPAPAQQLSTTTQYTGIPARHGNMFDIRVWQQMTIDRFDVHFADTGNPAPCGTTCSVNEVEVYWRWGGHEGAETQPNQWMLRGSVQHTISTGKGVPQPLSLPFDRTLVPGKAGFYITSTGPTNSVTGLPNERIRAMDFYKSTSNQYMSLQTGTDNWYPFGGFKTFGAWDGTVYYTPCQNAEVESYCQAGTSASGCQAVLQASGMPSATRNGGFVLTSNDVEGQKNGLFYFSSAGKINAPWGTTSSFKCVALPALRGALLSSGGTAGNCDGFFSYDLNAHWFNKPAHNPGAGVTVQAQLWYRNPQGAGSPKTAFSDAVEFVVCQ